MSFLFTHNLRFLNNEIARHEFSICRSIGKERERETQMKKIGTWSLLVSVLLILSLFAAACSGSGQSGSGASGGSASSAASGSGSAESRDVYKGQKLVVGVWGGSYGEAIEKFAAEPLRAKGAEVELVFGGTGDRIAKLYAEKGNPSMDVAFLNLFEAKKAIDDGVAQPVDPSIPNFDKLYPAAQQNGYGMTFMALGIVYNKELVKDPITSWKDLWREDLKGKVAFPNYPGFEGDSLIAIAALAFGKTLADEDFIFSKLQELKPIPMVYSNLDELFLELQEGFVLAAPIFNSYAYEFIGKGFPAEFVYPSDPGPIMAKDTIVIAEGTKNEALAKEFVSLAIGLEMQQHFAENLFFGPVNKDVKVGDETAAKIVYGPENVEKLVTLDWDTLIEKRPEWTVTWNSKVLSD